MDNLTIDQTHVADKPISDKRYQEVLERVLGWAVLFHDARTLGDVFRLPIGSIVEEAGERERANITDLEHLLDSSIAHLRVGAAIADAFSSLDSRRRIVVQQRIFAEDPPTLDVVGEQLNVSRQRARQLEVSATKRLDAAVGSRLEHTGRVLRRVFGIVAPVSRFDAVVGRLVGDAIDSLQPPAAAMLVRYSGYRKKGDIYGTPKFFALVEQVRIRCHELSDGFGLIDEETVKTKIEAHDPALWDFLVESAELPRIFRYLAVRDTRRARIAAALLSRGCILSKEELAKLTGIDVSRIGGVLFSMPELVRANKYEWGFSHWVEDAYEGVVTEIVQRIEEDGGATTVERLLTDIPAKFSVSPATVRTYLATPKFHVSAGTVSLATIKPFYSSLEGLDQVVWNEAGEPALIVRVEEKYLRGNSINIPTAAAAYIGVQLNMKADIPILEPAGCETASVIWRSHDPSGPELGRLREALIHSAAKPGMDIYVVLSAAGIRVRTDGTGFLPRHAQVREVATGDYEVSKRRIAALERMKSRRKF